MTDRERRQRIESICDAALDLAAHEREGFVASCCAGDEALRLHADCGLTGLMVGDEKDFVSRAMWWA
jgi:hypothetical protein